jgi:hypothetical protein
VRGWPGRWVYRPLLYSGRTLGRCRLCRAICTQPQVAPACLLRIRDYFRRAYSACRSSSIEAEPSEPGKRVLGLLRVRALLVAALPWR